MTDFIWRSRAAQALRIAETLPEGDARVLRAYAEECDAEARRVEPHLAPTEQQDGGQVVPA